MPIPQQKPGKRSAEVFAHMVQPFACCFGPVGPVRSGSADGLLRQPAAHPIRMRAVCPSSPALSIAGRRPVLPRKRFQPFSVPPARRKAGMPRLRTPDALRRKPLPERNFMIFTRFFFTEKEILIDLSASFVLLIKAEIDAEHGTFSRNRHNPARDFPAGVFFFCRRRFERATSCYDYETLFYVPGSFPCVRSPCIGGLGA